MTVYALALVVVAVAIGTALHRQRPCGVRDWLRMYECRAHGRHTTDLDDPQHVWAADEWLARYER